MHRIGLLSRVLDVLMPRPCAICGGRLTVSEEGVCAACRLHLPYTRFHLTPEDNDLVRLFWGIIPVERGAAWFYFEPHSQVARLVYAMKYFGKAQLGRTIGRTFAEELMGCGFFDGIDTIVPVPLTKGRERARGYNQSRMIAEGIAEATGLPVELRALYRQLFEESQTRKRGLERRDNVEGVFELRAPERVAGKHVLIVDDVVTTGATMTSCARELLKAGGVRVSFLSVGMTRS